MSNLTGKTIFKYRTLYLFLLPAVLSCFIFNYIPMMGVSISFFDYKVTKGFWGSEFVGLQHFRKFLTDPNFFRALRNTIGINGTAILIGFPLPIIFALILDSMKWKSYKKIAQTISYLPHFISWVVVAQLAYRILDERTGSLNMLIKAFGFESVPFMTDPGYFWGIVISVGIWKEIGWLSIIYLSALSSVDVEQYEAASIDGVKGYQKLFYITLPNILPTITLVFIFTVGTLVNTSGYFVIVPFDAIFNLRNALLSETANTIDFYVYQTGVMNSKYSYSTAIGITQSILAFLMVYGGNSISKKINGYGAF